MHDFDAPQSNSHVHLLEYSVTNIFRILQGDGTFFFPNGNRQTGKWVETAPEGEEGKTHVFWVGGELIVGQ
jgi:hypothetical protein